MNFARKKNPQERQEALMGRLSQLFWFLDEEAMPTELEIRAKYTHLSITPEIKNLRREHVRKIRADRKTKCEVTKK